METPPKWLAFGYIVLFGLMPWSFSLGFGTWTMDLPSQPVIVVLGVGLLVQFGQCPNPLFKLFCNNRLLQVSLAYLVWMFVSACFSCSSMVSWKYWVVEMGHWWVFALGISAFPDLWRRAFPWFVVSMVGVAVYALAHHGFYHFRADQALLAPKPFFSDHTIWAAALVMVLCLYRPFFPHLGRAGGRQVFQMVGFLLLLLALILSTCRAAWVTVGVVFCVWLFRNLGIRGRVWMLVGGLLLCFLGIPKLQQYVAQDVSLLERINRWSCALRMFEERPTTGYGPGTFQFQYLDFQRPDEMTRISVKEAYDHGNPHPFGRGGGAHSEYLRVLAETGWPGLLLWLGLVGLFVRRGFFYRPTFPGSLLLAMALLTFFVHNLVNEFLHDDRIAAMIWGGLAYLFVTDPNQHAKPKE